MNYEMMMKGGSGTKCKPQYWENAERFWSTFFYTRRESSVQNLHFQNQEKFVNIWLVLTIQIVMPVGFTYLTFVREKQAEKSMQWGTLFWGILSHKTQHYWSSLKEEKPLQLLIPHTLSPKNHNLFCGDKEGLKKGWGTKGKICDH